MLLLIYCIVYNFILPTAILAGIIDILKNYWFFTFVRFLTVRNQISIYINSIFIFSYVYLGALLRYNLFSFVYLLLWLLGALVPRAKISSPSSIAIVNWHRAAIILAALFLFTQIAFQSFLLARMQSFWKNYTYGQDFPNCIVFTFYSIFIYFLIMINF